VPANLQANSMLPKMSSFTKLPAILMLKTSPIPWSKINSDREKGPEKWVNLSVYIFSSFSETIFGAIRLRLLAPY
jgi:hypothetical protein